MRQETNRREETFMLPASEVRFVRQCDEDIFLLLGDGKHEVGKLAMAFPLSKRTQMVAVFDLAGEELGILDDLDRLDPRSQRIVHEEIEKSYFLPKIQDIIEITERFGLVTWSVITDRGPRVFQVRRIRQNIRRIGRKRVIIRDVDGNRFEIQNMLDLSLSSKRLLDGYL